MPERKNIRCEIYCQKGKKIEAEFSAEQGVYEAEDIYIEVTEEVRNGCRWQAENLKPVWQKGRKQRSAWKWLPDWAD